MKTVFRIVAGLVLVALVAGLVWIGALSGWVSFT